MSYLDMAFFNRGDLAARPIVPRTAKEIAEAKPKRLTLWGKLALTGGIALAVVFFYTVNLLFSPEFWRLLR